MKTVFLTILFMTLFAFYANSALAADHAIISQVLYDPAGSETGGEAVELFNPTAQSIDISGYVIMTESSDTDATIPDETILESGSYYLIADSGWSTLKDNISWRAADHEEAITMSNSDSGVALVFNDEMIDAVGWGDPAGIEPGLYEGMPAVSVSPGSSLKRIDVHSDTDDNSADFTEAVADFSQQTAESGNDDTNQTGENETGNGTGSELVIEVDIDNLAPEIIGYSIDYSFDDSIIPMPGADKTVNISVTATDPNGASDIIIVAAYISGPSPVSHLEATLTPFENLNSTTDRFEGSFDLPFWWPAGSYIVEFVVNDSAASDLDLAGFVYENMTAISIDTETVSFAGASPGASSELLGDSDLETSSPTIRNIGNTALDIGIYGEDLVSESGVITADNLQYSFDNDFESALSGTLSEETQLIDLNLEAAEFALNTFALQLFVPQSTLPGHYSGQTTIVAVSE